MAARHYACSPLRIVTRIAEPLPRQPARASNAPPAPRAKFDFNSNLCQQYACHGLHGTAAHSPTRLQPHPPRELARPTRTVTQAPQGDGPSMRGRQNATPTPTVSVSSLETACKAVVSKSTGPRPQSPAHPSVKDKAFFPPKPPTTAGSDRPARLHGLDCWSGGSTHLYTAKAFPRSADAKSPIYGALPPQKLPGRQPSTGLDTTPGNGCGTKVAENRLAQRQEAAVASLLCRSQGLGTMCSPLCRGRDSPTAGKAGLSAEEPSSRSELELNDNNR